MKSRSHVLKKTLVLTATLASTLSASTGCVDSIESSTSSEVAGSVAVSEAKPTAASIPITNISYDPMHELYEQHSQPFQEHWEEGKGQEVEAT